MARHGPAVLSFVIPLLLNAQYEWFFKKNSIPNENYWALAHGTGFSMGGHIYFGLVIPPNSGIEPYFRKYDPVTNTFVNFNWSGALVQTLPENAPTFVDGIGFSVGGHGYVGLGLSSTGFYETYSTIYRMHPTNEYWDQVITFPGPPRSNAIVFVIGDKAYIGGGFDIATSTTYGDLWEFDPADNSWTQRASMPTALSGGVAFALDGKGYVQRENSTVFWSYDPVVNAWAVKAPYPGGAREGAVGFQLGGKGYVGTGRIVNTNQKSFFAYDPITNTWSPAPAMWDAYGRYNALSVEHAGKAYVIGGVTGGVVAEIWELGPAMETIPGTWVQRPFLPSYPRESPVSFVIGNTAYVGGGGIGIGNWATDLWAYDPITRSWTQKADIPGQGALALGWEDKGYLLLYSDAGNFWEYDPVLDLWSPLADLPGGARSQTAGFAVEGRIYIGTGLVNGERTSDLWSYDPTSDSWTQKTSLPSTDRHSASGFVIGNKGYILGGNIGGGTAAASSCSEYDPMTDTWSNAGSLYNVQDAAAMAVGNTAYCAGGIVGSLPSKNFRAYDPATNSWSVQPTVGGGWRYNAAGFSVGGSVFISCGWLNPNSSTVAGVQRSNDLWEFVPHMITVSPKVFLGGPFDPITGMMSATLNTESLIPDTDPYGALGYPLPGGTYSDLGTQLPASSGNNTIVDRIVVEVRDAAEPSFIIASRHVWLQRDGDVVDMDGVSPVRFNLPPDTYYVGIRHRNHLGVMTASAISLSLDPATVDFTQSSTPTYGTNAQKNVNGTMLLWPGDVNFDGQVKYTGPGNDRDPILLAIGGTSPSIVVNGIYASADVNMDAAIKYTGTTNDRDIILQTIGGIVPTAVRVEQMP